MNAMVVWVMVIVNAHGSIWSTGPEFTTKERCEVAAQTMYKTVDELRWGMNIKKPICIKIEK